VAGRCNSVNLTPPYFTAAYKPRDAKARDSDAVDICGWIVVLEVTDAFRQARAKSDSRTRGKDILTERTRGTFML